VSRRYHLPGAQEAVLATLAARLDAVERTQTSQGKDISALGRGVAALTSQLRTTGLPGAGHRPGADTDTAPDTAATDATDADAVPDATAHETGTTTTGPERSSPQQRDWLAVTDPDTARDWLLQAQEWIDHVGVRCGLGLPACWPLHPGVVTEVLALSAERTAAYGSASTTTVSEYLGRWLPGARDRIHQALQGCLGGHQHQRTTFHVPALDLAAVATWWTRDRATPAPTALHLRPMDHR
jgi:hypothetical protein